MPDKDEAQEFERWLQDRVKESNLSASEVKEFTSWLMSCHCETRHDETKVTFKEVFELVGWFRGRMTELFVRDDERKELTGWLSNRLSSHACLSEEEMRQVCDGLQDKS
jgi:hypothetical protein